MLYGHLDRESVSHLSVINIERPNSSVSLSDRDMTWSVVPHQHDVVVVIDSVILRERTSGTECVKYFHRLSILDFVLPRDRHTSRSQHACAQNDRTDGVLAFGVASTLVIVGKRSQVMTLDQAVQGDGRASGANEFVG